MANKTVLVVPVSSTVDSGHFRGRFHQPVGPEGATGLSNPPLPPPSVFRLKETTSVNRVTVERDADGNLHITLED